MHKKCFVVFLAYLMSGCVGLGVGTYGKKEWVKTDFSLGKERNQFSFDNRKIPYSEEEIIANWGKPDAIETYKHCRILVYKDGTSWVGAGAFVGVIPVPLAVPSGTYKNRFYLQNDSALGVIQEYGEIDRAVGYACGSNECGAHTGEKINEPDIDAKVAIKQWCSNPI